MNERHWFIWWVERYGGGQWYGMRYLTDREAWDEEFALSKGSYVGKLYRWIWDGSAWQYDSRPTSHLLVPNSRFASLGVT